MDLARSPIAHTQPIALFRFTKGTAAIVWTKRHENTPPQHPLMEVAIRQRNWNPLHAPTGHIDFPTEGEKTSAEKPIALLRALERDGLPRRIAGRRQELLPGSRNQARGLRGKCTEHPLSSARSSLSREHRAAFLARAQSSLSLIARPKDLPTLIRQDVQFA